MTVLASEPGHAETLVVSESVKTRAAIDTGIVDAVIRVQETVPALVPPGALARVAPVEVDAGRPVLAGLGRHALVNVHLAPGALVAQGAGAGVPLVVAVGGAGGAVAAGVGGAGVHLPLAGLPVKRRITHAEEVVDPVDAGAAILAGAGDTVVDVDLAVLASEARLADALVGAELVVALAVVLTGVGVALVDLLVAGGAAPARGTVADEPGHVVLAVAPDARVAATLINVRLTPLPEPAGLTGALVVVDEVDTLASVLTRRGQTLVHVLLAQPASVARSAPTLEPVDLVHALALVEAGVAGALIHVDLAIVAIGSG